MKISPKLIKIREDLAEDLGKDFRKHLSELKETEAILYSYELLEEKISGNELEEAIYTIVNARLRFDAFLYYLKDLLAFMYGTEYTEGWTWKL